MIDINIFPGGIHKGSGIIARGTGFVVLIPSNDLHNDRMDTILKHTQLDSLPSALKHELDTANVIHEIAIVTFDTNSVSLTLLGEIQATVNSQQLAGSQEVQTIDLEEALAYLSIHTNQREAQSPIQPYNLQIGIAPGDGLTIDSRVLPSDNESESSFLATQEEPQLLTNQNLPDHGLDPQEPGPDPSSLLSASPLTAQASGPVSNAPNLANMESANPNNYEEELSKKPPLESASNITTGSDTTPLIDPGNEAETGSMEEVMPNLADDNYSNSIEQAETDLAQDSPNPIMASEEDEPVHFASLAKTSQKPEIASAEVSEDFETSEDFESILLANVSEAILNDDPLPDSSQISNESLAKGIIIFDDGATYILDKSYVIGRDPSISSPEFTPITPKGETITLSRTHAELRIDADIVTVADLDSTNGTYVWQDKEQVWEKIEPGSPRTLESGVTIAIGKRTFFYDDTSGMFSND